MWIKLKYHNHYKKSIGHTAWITSNKELEEILIRHNIATTSIYECTLGNDHLTTTEIEKYLSENNWKGEAHEQR